MDIPTALKQSRVPFQLVGRYASRNKWEVLSGPGDSRPTALEIIHDADLLNALPASFTILITGISSGIGLETARALLATGATVYGTARNISKAEAALAPLLATGRLHLLHIDQSDLSSVRACAAEFRRRSGGRLNVLINNAAVMNTPEGERSKDGFELQFATNHLSHFLLVWELRDLLRDSATEETRSRVVGVSSAGHRFAEVRFEDVNLEGEYNGWLAYGASKTAVIWNMNQVDRLFKGEGIRAYSVHPGAFESPNLQKHSTKEMEAVMQSPLMRKYLMSMEQAAATTVYAAVSRDLEGKGGIYLEGASHSALPLPKDGDEVEYGYGEWAFDQEKEERLWELSKQMCKVE